MQTTTTAKPSYWKSNEEIALLLTLGCKPKTDAGRAVRDAVLARVEAAIAAKK